MSFANEYQLPSIKVEELGQRLSQDDLEGVQLIDVREPQELELAQLNGFMNLPLSQSAAWVDRITEILDPHAETIVLCHHGVRSAQLCTWLIRQGFTNVRNVTGGIDAYSQRVDPAIPQY